MGIPLLKGCSVLLVFFFCVNTHLRETQQHDSLPFDQIHIARKSKKSTKVVSEDLGEIICVGYEYSFARILQHNSRPFDLIQIARKPLISSRLVREIWERNPENKTGDFGRCWTDQQKIESVEPKPRNAELVVITFCAYSICSTLRQQKVGSRGFWCPKGKKRFVYLKPWIRVCAKTARHSTRQGGVLASHAQLKCLHNGFSVTLEKGKSERRWTGWKINDDRWTNWPDTMEYKDFLTMSKKNAKFVQKKRTQMMQQGRRKGWMRDKTQLKILKYGKNLRTCWEETW